MKGIGIALCLVAFAAHGGVNVLSDLPWIGDGLPDRNGADWYEEDPAPEFKAEFVLPPGVTETKIHFVCAGFGSFSLDGSYMNPDGLDTLWTPYDKTVYSTTTRTIRVTDATNTVFVRLGNGFYNLPPLRFWGHRLFREVVAHGRPCFKMAIDGVERPLEWRWRKTNVIRNSVYLGTEIDATRPEDTEWKPAAVVKGPKGKIVEWPSTNPGMISSDVHHGTARWLKEGEVQVVDFGVNASGVPEFIFKNAARGTRVEIRERFVQQQQIVPVLQRAGQQFIRRESQIGLHFGTRHTDAPPNLGEFRPRFARDAENPDVGGVGQGAVTRDEREKRRLAAAVFSPQNPALALANRP